MDNKLAWDDLKLILAITDETSIANAGLRLGMSYATVHRRLGQIEDRIGVALFHRTRAGSTPTLAAEELAETARKIEGQVLEAERRIVGRDLRPSGLVRLTTLDTILVGILSPILVDFQKAQQDITLDVVVSNQLQSLSKREADVAVRPSDAPDETLVGRKIAKLAYAAYGRRDLVHGQESVENLTRLTWLGPGDGMRYPKLEAWMDKHKLLAGCRYRVSSLLAMHAAVKDGQGFAVLPCYLADRDPGLARVTTPLPELDVDLWLLTHKDLRKTARVRVFLDFIAEAVKRKRPQLAGLLDEKYLA